MFLRLANRASEQGSKHEFGRFCGSFKLAASASPACAAILSTNCPQLLRSCKRLHGVVAVTRPSLTRERKTGKNCSFSHLNCEVSVAIIILIIHSLSAGLHF